MSLCVCKRKHWDGCGWGIQPACHGAVAKPWPDRWRLFDQSDAVMVAEEQRREAAIGSSWAGLITVWQTVNSLTFMKTSPTATLMCRLRRCIVIPEPQAYVYHLSPEHACVSFLCEGCLGCFKSFFVCFLDLALLICKITFHQKRSREKYTNWSILGLYHFLFIKMLSCQIRFQFSFEVL